MTKIVTLRSAARIFCVVPFLTQPTATVQQTCVASRMTHRTVTIQGTVRPDHLALTPRSDYSSYVAQDVQ